MSSTGNGVQYVGARFFKCDLQMQTHMDANNWRGPTYGKSEGDLHRAAQDYMLRCYETGLEVIAITDHNYASKEFTPYLREAARNLGQRFGYEITIFPGFEINANVGKGMHCLAIFNHDADLTEIDHILTRCGVPYPRFRSGQAVPSTKRLSEILAEVQKRDASGYLQGIVICPHSQAEAGIFDNDAISEWLQQEEFTNPDLLAIEVPKPPDRMSANWQCLLKAGPDCLQEWRRRRSIACIMSSDAKALQPEDGAENYIGFRHAWIKMSDPSIEALRQAFLDHDSRVRLEGPRPEDRYTHPRILSVCIRKAAFLADQSIAFSPNLNTIIGGRGTGKSSVVEYLRIGLDQETTIGGDEANRNASKLKHSLKESSIIDISFIKEETRWALRSIGGNAPTVVAGEGLTQIGRFFPVRIFSQREIFEIAESPSARRQIVEDTARMRLDELSRREDDLVRVIRELNHNINELPALQNQVRELETEITELVLRIKRLEGVMQPLAAWQRFREEAGIFDGMRDRARALAEGVSASLDATLVVPQEVAEPVRSGPYGSLGRELCASAEQAIGRFRRSILQAQEVFLREIDSLFEADGFLQWKEAYEKEKDNFEQIQSTLAEQGIDPSQYLRYHAERKDRQEEIARIRDEISERRSLLARRDGTTGEGEEQTPGLMSELEDVWAEQSIVMEEASVRLTESLPYTVQGEPFLKIEVERFGDEAAFIAKMREFLRDRRRIGEEDWDILMKSAFAAALRGAVSPMKIVADELATLRSAKTSVSTMWPTRRYHSVLTDWLRPDVMTELRLWRTPDRVSVELFRQDGSRVGYLDGPELSIGQRCTAILAMVLARDDVPVIIDQPEEDLDNEFIYRELVPLIRRVKEERQVIFVSHNANIPVNADAELITALEVNSGRGVQKAVDGKIAIGGLDRRPVQIAVEEIMEGSEEAFRKRYEKYGF